MSRTAADRLVRALMAPLDRFDCAIAVKTASRPWVSATFAGARHALAIELSGARAAAAADALLDGIEEREFDLSGHVVIDIAAVDRALNAGAILVSLEALTVEAD